MVLTGVDPLRIYLYGDGLCRMASRKYSSEKESFNDPYVHLDSIDVNERNTDETKFNIPTLETEGLRSTVMRVLQHFERTENVSKEKVWNEIRDVVVKSVLCAENEMVQSVRKFVKNRNMCFDLMGYDILLDKNFKPWIIEINHSPSMAPLTEMENRIKYAMLHDYFVLADLTLKDREPLREIVSTFQEKLKELKTNEPLYCLEDFENLDKLNVARLSDRDIFTLVNAWMENERKGGFERLFPAPDMKEKYGQFYKKNRNVLHELWIRERRTVADFVA